MRTPAQGGIMNGGRFNGRIMAYDQPVMPCYDDTGLRIGTYFWDEDHWEYEDDTKELPEM
jgi:hypothetical protein